MDGWKEGKKKETTTTKYFKKNRLLCFVCEPKVDWKLIQSAPERGHPGDGRWGPQIRKIKQKWKKKKREKLSLFQILPPSVVCVCMYINIHTQAHLCLYTKLTTKKGRWRRWPEKERNTYVSNISTVTLVAAWTARRWASSASRLSKEPPWPLLGVWMRIWWVEPAPSPSVRLM